MSGRKKEFYLGRKLAEAEKSLEPAKVDTIIQTWLPSRFQSARHEQYWKFIDLVKMVRSSKTLASKYHVPGYQYLARGDPGKNQLNRIAKQHDID